MVEALPKQEVRVGTRNRKPANKNLDEEIIEEGGKSYAIRHDGVLEELSDDHFIQEFEEADDFWDEEVLEEPKKPPAAIQAPIKAKAPAVQSTSKATPKQTRLSDKLNYSLKLDIQKTSTDKEVDKLVTRIEADLRKHGGLKLRHNLVQVSLRVLLVNLYSHWRIDTDLYTSLTFNKTAYKARSRYNALGVSDKIIEITNSLKKLDYLEYHRGFRNRDVPELSRNSRIKPKKKLSDEFQTLKANVSASFQRPDNEETIILRGPKDASGHKPKIEYKDADVPQSVSDMRTNLERLNSELANTVIELDLTDPQTQKALQSAKEANRVPDLTKKKLYRVFNNESWDQGGRFYRAWWTGAPKYLRPFIRIGSSEKTLGVLEIDYSCIHIDMLYAREGINFHKDVGGDPYVISEFKGDRDIRKFCKIALQMIINARDKDSAVKAIGKEMIGLPRIRERVKKVGGIKAAINKFAEEHKPIEKHFYTGIGLHLQYEDSQIAERVMLGALDQGFVVLPVHDSFLCAYTESIKLYRLMVDAYVEHMQSSGIKTPSDPFPTVKIAGLRFADVIEEHVTRRELGEIYPEQLAAWHAELAEDAGTDDDLINELD